MGITKSKLRSKLTDEHLQAVLRILSTDLELKLNDIITRKQLHKSHTSD